MLEKILALLDFRSLATKGVEFLPGLVAGLLILLLFWIVYRITRVTLKAVFRRAGFHETLIYFLVDNVYRLLLFSFGLVMAVDQVGINVGAALAGLGVAGIAIGFAAQDSLANIIAGFLIFWDKPFQVGDWVTVSEQYGKVVEITLRTSRIRTNRNTYVVIPNKNIIDVVLENHTKHGETRVEIPIGIAYKESIPRAREVLLAAVEGVEGVVGKPAPDLVVEACGSSSVDLRVRVWIEDASLEQQVFYQVMEACKLGLDKAGIEIPYPHLQLFLEKIEDRVWQRAAQFPPLAALGNEGVQHSG